MIEDIERLIVMVNLGELDKKNSLGNEVDFLNGWKSAHEKEQIFSMNLKLRINYIISKIFKTYDNEYNNGFIIIENRNDEMACYECGGPEINIFNYICWKDFESGIKYIKYDTEIYHKLSSAPGYYDNKCINLRTEFPYKWIFSDFEDELKVAKQAYIDFNIKRDAEKLKKKQDKLNSKDEKVRLKEQLKAKLTSEELALISFKK